MRQFEQFVKVQRHLTLFLLSLVLTTPAMANCGIDICPVGNETDESGKPIRPGTGLRHTAVENNAAYTELFASMMYEFSNPLQVGVHVPMVSAHQQDDRTTGLGNIVVLMNNRWSTPDGQSILATGLQLEIPTVQNPLLGDSHLLILPTIQAGWSPTYAAVVATIGWGQTLSGSHNHAEESTSADGHDHSAHDHGDAHGSHSSAVKSIVNPHADSELLVRIDTTGRWDLSKHAIRLGLRTDAIQEVSGDKGVQPIINMGPTLALFGETLTTELYGLLPVTSARRYTLRTGLRIQARFP